MRVLFFSSAKSIKLFTTLSIILIKSSYWELAVGLFYAFVKKSIIRSLMLIMLQFSIFDNLKWYKTDIHEIYTAACIPFYFFDSDT